MPSNRTPLQRPNRIPLSHEAEMSLRYGEMPHRPGFASEEERRAAWFHHRDHLLQHCRWGKRPAAWWDYECPIRRPRDHDYEEAALFEAGLLTETEVAELTKLWRERFEQAQRPDFAYCIGHANPGDTFASWLHGEPAKRAHLKWAGVPRSLIRKWTAQRRRRGKTIRELETASSAEPAV
jgi:hypothetical protein